jgi:hypothetical protein
MTNKIFCLGIALLATHELDAMTHKEWELLLPFLDSWTGQIVFVLLHIPIFYFFFYFHNHRSIKMQNRFRIILSVFLAIHGVAHFLFSLFHEAYTFIPPLETITVYGSAICGLTFLYLKTVRNNTK